MPAGTYGDEVDDVQVLAQQHMSRWWADVERREGPVDRDGLAREFDEVQRLYGEQAAYAAADYLFHERSLDATLADLEYPTPAEPVSAEDSASSVEWALWPWAEHLDPASAAVSETRLSGVLSRLVSLPATNTIIDAAIAAGTGFDRLPEPGACDFCLMMASYGPAYSRDDMQRRSRMHDHCRCVGVEVKDGDDVARIHQDLQELRERGGGDDDGFNLQLRGRRNSAYLDRLAAQVEYTEAEQAAILRWQGTDQHYAEVQKVSEGHSADEEAMEAAETLDAAARKMRTDKPMEMWRGARDVEAVIGVPIEELEPGRDLTSTRFTSVSTDRAVITDYTTTGERPAVFRTRVAEGTPGVWLPEHGEEAAEYRTQQELLLPPDVSTKVVGVSTTDDGIPLIDLEVSS